MRLIVKKIMVVMLAVMMISASAVMAQEGQSDGNSLGDLIGGLVPENFDLGEALGGLKDTLSGVTGSISEIPENLNLGEILGGLKDKLSEVTEKIGDIPGSLNLDEVLSGLTDKLSGVTGDLGGLLGSITGSGEEAAESETAEDSGTEEAFTEEDLREMGLDDYDLNYAEVNEAIISHLQDEFSEYLESGDEQVCSLNVAKEQSEEDGTIRLLGYFIVANFDANESDLVLKNSAGSTELLTIAKNAEGVYEVTDSQAVADGDDYLEGLEPLCESLGITTDDFFNEMTYIDMTYTVDLYVCLRDNPEYERIEYDGNLLTLEELDAEIDAQVDTLISLFDTAAEAEAETAAE